MFFSTSAYALLFSKVESAFSLSWRTVFYITNLNVIDQFKQKAILKNQKYTADIQFTNDFDDVVTSKRIRFALESNVIEGNGESWYQFGHYCFITYAHFIDPN